jgi:hypothetical protein
MCIAVFCTALLAVVMWDKIHSSSHCCCFLTMFLVIFPHAILLKILKPGCASSFETHSYLNKPDSTWHLFIIPCIKHTIQYNTVTLWFPGLLAMYHEPQTISTRDLYWGIIDIKKYYQPRTNIVRDEKGDFFYRLPLYFG